MANWFVDPSGRVGNDTTGDGTSESTSYASVKKLLDTDAIAAGDNIYVNNEGEDSISGSWSWTWVTTAVDNPVRFIASEFAGATSPQYKTRPDGTTVPLAKIDGNANSSITGSGTDSYVSFKGFAFRNTTSYLIYYNNGWIFEDCYFTDASGTHLVTGAGSYQQFINCRFVGGNAGVAALRLTWGSLCEDCEFETFADNGIEFGSNGITITRCVFKNIDGHAVSITNRDAVHVTHCTFDNDGHLDAVAIYLGSSNTEMCNVKHNLITNYDGASATAIAVTATCAAGVLGPNAFYNCTTEVDLSGAAYIDNTGDDVTLPADPYTDRASDDYSLTEASPAFASATSPTQFVADFSRSFGAIQQVQAAGGGGGGDTNTNEAQVWNDGVPA